MNGARKHPAEWSGGLAGAVAALIVYFGGVDDPAIVPPLIVVVGAIPAGVTWLVNTMRGRREGGANA